MRFANFSSVGIDKIFIGRPHLSIDAHPIEATYDDDFISFSKILQSGIFDEARRFYESGLSLEQTAKRLKRSKAFIRDTLIAGGVSMRPSLQTPEGKEIGKRRHVSGPAPYGFTYLRGQLVMHPLEIEHLLGILDSWKKGCSARSIAIQLNQSCVPSKKGKLWDHSAVLSVVKFHREKPDLLASIQSAGLIPVPAMDYEGSRQGPKPSIEGTDKCLRPLPLSKQSALRAPLKLDRT